jgi:hypothetical protein
MSTLAAPPKPVRNQITKIDAVAQEFTITDGEGGFKTYRFKPTTEVLLNNQRSSTAALAPGMIALVATGDPGTASRIMASVPVKPTLIAKPVPPTAQVRFPASTGEEKPHIHGSVKAGQKVTVTPVKVWWEGGGSRKGKFTDWHGYPGSRNNHDKPWMALIAQVGGNYFSPKDGALSFTVPTDGVLVFFCNDEKAEGNEGSASISVTITGP